MAGFNIPNLFEKIAVANNLNYNRETMPFIPYGVISGKKNSYKTIVYIRQIESGISTRLVTYFSFLEIDFLPKDFCIDFGYNINKRKIDLEEQFILRSYNLSIIKDFFDDKKKEMLADLLNKIGQIEDNIFKLRCSFRLSANETYISIEKVFETFEDLNIAFSSVHSALTTFIDGLKGTNGGPTGDQRVRERGQVFILDKGEGT